MHPVGGRTKTFKGEGGYVLGDVGVRVCVSALKVEVEAADDACRQTALVMAKTVYWRVVGYDLAVRMLERSRKKMFRQ
jgi:hypothetical protein